MCLNAKNYSSSIEVLETDLIAKLKVKQVQNFAFKEENKKSLVRQS